jgi:hypothetical protein
MQQSKQQQTGEIGPRMVLSFEGFDYDFISKLRIGPSEHSDGIRQVPDQQAIAYGSTVVSECTVVNQVMPSVV